ncbi:MAG: hypothetical protein KY475_17720 [Planctomycetes bacterium]|nr:hypothetical protein [Planctomycetota bacterium]
MSHYLIEIGEALASVLERATTTQPEQFAGYIANLDFWLGEYEHLATVVAGYDERLRRLREAYDRYLGEQSGPHNLDDVGDPYAAPARTTKPHERVVRPRSRGASPAANRLRHRVFHSAFRIPHSALPCLTSTFTLAACPAASRSRWMR